MPILKNGATPDFIRYVDANGDEFPIIKVTVGDDIVWDGTRPAYPAVTRMLGGGSFRVPSILAGQSIEVPRIGGSTGELVSPAIRAGAAIAAEKLLGLPGDVNDVDLTAAASVLDFESFKATGQAYDVGAGAAEPGAVFAPKMVGTGSLSVPVAAVPIELEVTLLSAVGEAYAVTVAGNAAVEVTQAIGSGLASAVEVKAGQTLTVTSATGTALVRVPVISAGRNITIPAPFTGAGYVGVPKVQTTIPMGMYCTVTQRYDDGNTSWAPVYNMSALPAYPGTVIQSGASLVLSAGPHLITAKCTWAGAGPDVAIFINGVNVKDSSGMADTVSETITYNHTAVAGDTVTMMIKPYSTSASNRPVQSGQTTTYLTAVP